MTQGTVPFKYSLPAACSTICCCLSSFLLNGFTLKQNCSHCWTQSGQVSTPPSTEPAACHGFPHLDISCWPPAPEAALHLSGGPFFIARSPFTASRMERVSLCAGCSQRLPSDTRACHHMARFMLKQERSGGKGRTKSTPLSMASVFCFGPLWPCRGCLRTESSADGRRCQRCGGRRPSGAAPRGHTAGSRRKPRQELAPTLPRRDPRARGAAHKRPRGPGAFPTPLLPAASARETHSAGSHFHHFVASGISWIRGRFIRTPCGREEVSSQGQCGVNYILSTPPLLIAGYKKYKKEGGGARSGGRRKLRMKCMNEQFTATKRFTDFPLKFLKRCVPFNAAFL